MRRPSRISDNDVIRGWGEAIRFGGYKAASEYIPTWQRNFPQPTPADYERYAAEGYGRNSIIYSCVREIATSFAELPIAVVRPDAEGNYDPVQGHPAVALMQNPSGECDEYEFAITLATHLLVAGNAYIEKIRRSSDPARRTTYRVQELGLIRPDYVSIVPGAKRADDVFEVSIGGTVVKRLPRADVIHIKLPNPANDFYGLSPIEVIVREADVDKLLTDYDAAFFRNAGVPMGLLKTKARHSPDEVQQIKGSFRRSFNGVKRWFELLVLNSEEAEYQPLGGMPKDMEQVSTRDFVESRVCAVYGVPPILVGVMAGLQHATYSNYEQAQFSFWSETMRPFARMVASALTRELLPEFATTADRGARMEYSYRNVAALQEDNTARLTGVTAMVQSGGFTVNQALTYLGFSALPDGDFYVRQLSQVIDVALPQQSLQQVTAPAEPVAAARSEIVGVKADSRVGRERLRRRAQADLIRFFDDQLDRVLSRLPSKDAGDDLIPDSEVQRLLEVLLPHYASAIRFGWEDASGALGLPADYDPADPRVRALIQEAGQRVTGITEETRRQLVQVLDVARGEGLSIAQVREMIQGLGAFSESRAETIARTELATADNLGAAGRFESSGIVSEVEIIDGPECGWEAHDDPDLAHGSIRTLEEARATPISHPNCVRSMVPVIRRPE